jgi:tRNA-Thr(GGU) m(6)t(6)A37 methyltransferase TsaA
VHESSRFQVLTIGVIRSPFTAATGTPIQPSQAAGAQGAVEIWPAYIDALADLDGFERIWLIYWFDRCREYQPSVIPFRDQQARGLFATRAPSRPNPIGISAVRLLAIRNNVLEVGDIDVLDGTPLLDIKPYVPEFDCYERIRAGWLDKGRGGLNRDDGRFSTD